MQLERDVQLLTFERCLRDLWDTSEEEFADKRFRNVRSLLHKIYKQKLEPLMFEGVSEEVYKRNLSNKLRKKQLISKKQHHDKELMKTREMRRQRMQKLENLTQQSEFNLPLIPDGAANLPTNLISNSNPSSTLNSFISCYKCKSRFIDLHFFYSHFCPTCASLNWSKRNQTIDMSQKICLVTGARIKIGFETALKLLRMGAFVLVTTRFPNDAFQRYKCQNDFPTFRNRLKIAALDFKRIKDVEALCEFVRTNFGKLDVLINNACQTIRRPLKYYEHLKSGEQKLLRREEDQEEVVVNVNDRFVGEIKERVVKEYDESERYFPEGFLDTNGQQIDLREKNSWVMKLDEIETTELIEVLAVNAVAPFILCSRLKPLLVAAAAEAPAFVVNVSAMEGKFYRYKNSNHPHTNMAKAALNMLTRTSADDYRKQNIFMNSVDTGWINDENPVPSATRIHEQNDFQTPIDEVDAASRILDPVVSGLMSNPTLIHGKFLKDYYPTEW